MCNTNPWNNKFHVNFERIDEARNFVMLLAIRFYIFSF